MNVNELSDQLSSWYGTGASGMAPTQEQWKAVLSRAPEKPLTLINFFKVRDVAGYSDRSDNVSGQEAFARYSAVSIPTMERVGGAFLFVGPYGGTFLGDNEDWDLVAIGSYPNLQSFIDLYTDEGYRSVFPHRTAAVERQKVLICGE